MCVYRSECKCVVSVCVVVRNSKKNIKSNSIKKIR
jgi:hypothetical protein